MKAYIGAICIAYTLAALPVAMAQADSTAKADITAEATRKAEGYMSGILSVDSFEPQAGIAHIANGMFVWDGDDGQKRDVNLLFVQRGRNNYLPVLAIQKVGRESGDTADLYFVGKTMFLTANGGPLDKLLENKESAIQKLMADLDTASIEERAQIQKSIEEYELGANAQQVRQILGKPAGAPGVLRSLFRYAGFEGLYFAPEDSLAFGKNASSDNFRHVYAHEYAHVFQRIYGKQLAPLWCGTAEMTDPYSYGYGNILEQQAEATAYAIIFLQSLAENEQPAQITALEADVPGTKRMISILATHPAFTRNRAVTEKLKLEKIPKRPKEWTWNPRPPRDMAERQENMATMVRQWAVNECGGKHDSHEKRRHSTSKPQPSI